MLHGTRSHPTQAFASLYGKLADVDTSNGFCFCVDSVDCMVEGSAGECTLLDTIRSMYDGRFRAAKLLTQNDQVRQVVCLTSSNDLDGCLSVCPARPAPPLSVYFLISYFFFFFSAPEKKKNKYE